jgi:hypothetical protein
MSLVVFKPDVPVTEFTNPEGILEPRNSNFTTLTPPSKVVSLLQFAEGFPWTVNYYGQIVSKSNSLETFDPTVINLSSPYYRIESLILQVSSPISSSYDSASGVTTVEGTCLTPYGVTPNVGDVFIANVETGEDAIFIVNNVIRKTYRKDTLYEINYHLLGYTNSNLAMVNTLDGRVQDRYYYNKDSNYYNRDYLVTPEVKEAIDRLQTFMVQAKEYYFTRFFSKAGGAIFLPNKEYKVYDPLLINFLMNTTDVSTIFSKMSLFHTSNDEHYNTPNILTAIQTRDKNYIKTLCKDYYGVPASYLNNKARFGGMYLAGVDYVIYPAEVSDKYSIDGQPSDLLPEDSIPFNTAANYTGYNRSIELTTGLKNLFPVYGIDNKYIVSKAFYDYCDTQSPDNASAISYIELILYKYLHEIAVTKKDLVLAIEDYDKWDSLVQFYWMPVLFAVLRNLL